MKKIVYYLVLLVLIVLLTAFLFQGDADSMSMEQMISVSVLLALYAVAMSVVGEGKVADERELSHRYTSNRLALLAGTIVLCAGVLVQLFTHTLDYWLLAGLIAINLVKIASRLYSNYRH